jgi:hypothetical protein
MTVALLLLLAAAILVLAVYLRGTDLGRRTREPRPGEDMPPPHLTYVPDDETVVLRTLPAQEAQVVRGLLETSGIPVKLRGMDELTPYLRTPPRAFRVIIPIDRVEEAEALLAD